MNAVDDLSDDQWVAPINRDHGSPTVDGLQETDQSASGQDIQPKKEFDLVVDCTGSSSGLPTAVQYCKPRGTVVLKTTVAGEQTLSLAPIVIDEITVVGSRCGPFATALKALQEDLIDVLPLISSRFPLEQGASAIEEARVKPVLKVILDVEKTP